MPYLGIHMLYYICIFYFKLKQNVTQKYWYFKLPINIVDYNFYSKLYR